jgi:hypothetical protein
MPGLDRTGPSGGGPGTGRRLGRCTAGSTDRVADSGGFFPGTFRSGAPRSGGGRGGGSGGLLNRWRNFWATRSRTSTMETESLRAELAATREQLAAMVARVEELERKGQG